MMKKGFTLIELLLYISIFSVVMVTVIFFLQAALQGKVKNQVIDQTNEESQQALLVMTQTIRNATSITVPALGNSAAAIALVVPDSSKSPTVFDVANGQLRIKEGAGTAAPLTSSRMAVSGVSFANMGRAGTAGSIRIIFTSTAVTSSQLQQFNYAQTYEATATIRN